ncbi:MAG TPA: hypothetical protein VHH72_03290 [Solirubrobacterales bacterium]|jgi:hypothetical protein|nr:hypothetical protein [Solirubrobacterales bacterium]
MDERLLRIYLADHLAGSSGGSSLANRIARENDGNEYGHEMAQIARQIEEDRESLQRIMETVGARKRRWRQAGAWMGEKAMRLKPNGRLFGYSPLSRVLELEAIIMGVTGKVQLWRGLKGLAERDSRLSSEQIARLEGRAEDQRKRLESLHSSAAAEAFIETRPAAGGRVGSGELV